MAIRINLPSGQTVILDELTGNITAAVPAPDNEPGLPPPPADEPAPSTARTVAPPRTAATSTYTAPAGSTYAAPAGVTPTAAAQIAYQREQDFQQVAAQQAALAEQQRQYDETFGMNKAKYNQDFAENSRQYDTSLGENSRQFDTNFGENQRQFDVSIGERQEDRDVTRGNTLLGLGSRPDTLIKYLYALRGQQVPQGFENTTQNLPGYQNVLGTGAQATAPTLARPVAPTLAPSAPLPAPGPTYQNMTQTSTAGQFAGIPANAAVQNVAGTPISLSDWAVKNQSILPGAVPYAGGGIIPEPVVGIGLRSGQSYTFGEKGPEEVEPAEKPYANSGTGSFAYGGTIGYEPPNLAQEKMDLLETTGQPIYNGTSWYQTPPPAPQPSAPQQYTTGLFSRDTTSGTRTPQPFMSGQSGQSGQSYAPPSLFNPSGLAGNIAGPLNPNGNPNFPQFSHFTGGGQSLIPSAQRLNQSTGSERSLYSGFLQDEAGVVPEDIWELVRKLSPRVSGLRTPSFVG